MGYSPAPCKNMENLQRLKNHLKDKEEENKRFGKHYWIEENERGVFVHKRASIPCQSNVLCARLLVEYYNNVLNLPFKLIITENTIEYISPIVQTTYDLSTKPNVAFTNNILKSFMDVYKNECKAFLKPGYIIRAYVADDNIFNFFRFDGHDYLLDLEEFYVCVYNKHGNNVGADGFLNTVDKEMIKVYKPNYIDNKKLLRDNMLMIL